MHSRSSWIALAALGLALSGCNYFRPAQPELPRGSGTQGSGVHVNYSAPDSTLATLKLAIQDKSATNGQSAYVGGLADPTTDDVEFTATFDPLTLARFSTPPSTAWGLQNEQLFYAALSQIDASFTFSFTWGVFQGAVNDELNPTTATLYRSYTLRATQDGGATYINEARGNAELHLILSGSRWKIVKWIDSEDPHAEFINGEKSFGYLRLGGR